MTIITPVSVRMKSVPKSEGAIWSLQKAIQYSFDQALDKSITLNFWSFGLGLCLHTWNTNHDKLMH